MYDIQFCQSCSSLKFKLVTFNGKNNFFSYVSNKNKLTIHLPVICIK